MLSKYVQQTILLTTFYDALFGGTVRVHADEVLIVLSPLILLQQYMLENTRYTFKDILSEITDLL